MTSRQRVAAALRGRPLDRVPVDMWWTPETAGRLMAHFRLDSEQQLRDRLGVDLAWLWVEPLPAPAGRPAPAVRP